MTDDITNFEYYNMGVAPGVMSKEPVYALYDVISDCFLIVLPNKSIITYLKYILSARYHLHICQISTAANYADTMITNETCDQWSLSNRNSINFTDPISDLVNHVDELCATRLTPQYNIVKEKQWCMFCAHYLYIIYNERHHIDFRFEYFYWQYSKLDEYLNSFLDITEATYVTPTLTDSAKKAILKLLYLGQDYATVNQQVKEIVAGHE